MRSLEFVLGKGPKENLHMMEKVKIDSFESIRDFYWSAIDAMTDQSETVGWKKGIYPSDQFLRTSIENGEMYALVRDGVLVASVILNHSWNEGYEGIDWGMACDSKDVIVPHALLVAPSCQKQGVGRSLVQEIIDFARKKGVKTIRLDLLPRNVAAKRLYEGIGFSFVQAKTMYYEDTGWTEFHMYEMIL